MTKTEMRRHYLELRKSRPQELLRSASDAICTRVLSLPQLADCKTVMLYISFGAEADTHVLAEKLIAQGKTVCAPRCDARSLSMTPYCFDGISSLREGAYGILEPEPTKPAELCEIDCVLVPGCVFGRNFHRIGYGKGYYDRFLRRLHHALKIGLCYDFCLTERVAAEPLDVPMDMIVTENEVLRNEHSVF